MSCALSSLQKRELGIQRRGYNPDTDSNLALNRLVKPVHTCRLGSRCPAVPVARGDDATTSIATPVAAAAVSTSSQMQLGSDSDQGMPHLQPTTTSWFAQRTWVLHKEATNTVPQEETIVPVSVMSFNTLADTYAHYHAAWLYKDVPRHCLSWQHRRHLVLEEIKYWGPDIICLQEVEHYDDLEADLEAVGYESMYLQRAGWRRDGCATFWLKDKFKMLERVDLGFADFDLEDNVALLVVLQPLLPSKDAPPSHFSQHASDSVTATQVPTGAQAQGGGSPTNTTAGSGSEDKTGSTGVRPSSSSAASTAAAAAAPVVPPLVISNTHICFDPSKGNVKLGQVKTLFNTAAELGAKWNGLVVLGGDFNTAPNSPLYTFMETGALDVSCFSKDVISGQVKGYGYPNFFNGQPHPHPVSHKNLTSMDALNETADNDDDEDGPIVCELPQTVAEVPSDHSLLPLRHTLSTILAADTLPLEFVPPCPPTHDPPTRKMLCHIHSAEWGGDGAVVVSGSRDEGGHDSCPGDNGNGSGRAAAITPRPASRTGQESRSLSVMFHDINLHNPQGNQSQVNHLSTHKGHAGVMVGPHSGRLRAPPGAGRRQRRHPRGCKPVSRAAKKAQAGQTQPATQALPLPIQPPPTLDGNSGAGPKGTAVDALGINAVGSDSAVKPVKVQLDEWLGQTLSSSSMDGDEDKGSVDSPTSKAPGAALPQPATPVATLQRAVAAVIVTSVLAAAATRASSGGAGTPKAGSEAIEGLPSPSAAAAAAAATDEAWLKTFLRADPADLSASSAPELGAVSETQKTSQPDTRAASVDADSGGDSGAGNGAVEAGALRLADPMVCSWWEGGPVVGHKLQVQSSYRDVTGTEPGFSSVHHEYLGCCDYLWYTRRPLTPTLSQGKEAQQQGARQGEQQEASQEGGRHEATKREAEMRCVAVLGPPNLAALPTGLPSQHWGSDHIPLVADYEIRVKH